MIWRLKKTSFKRRGSTLVELLATITVTTLLLGMVGIVTHTLARSQRTTSREINSRRTLAQLSLQFRADAHAATSVDSDPPAAAEDGQSLTITMASEETVQYRIRRESTEIERVVGRGDATVGREIYRLSPGDSARFEPIGPATPRLVTLVITRSVAGQPSGKGRERRIVAAVGLIRDQGDHETERDADLEGRDS
jgi:hypothetical protein